MDAKKSGGVTPVQTLVRELATSVRERLTRAPGQSDAAAVQGGPQEAQSRPHVWLDGHDPQRPPSAPPESVSQRVSHAVHAAVASLGRGLYDILSERREPTAAPPADVRAPDLVALADFASVPDSVPEAFRRDYALAQVVGRAAQDGSLSVDLVLQCIAAVEDPSYAIYAHRHGENFFGARNDLEALGTIKAAFDARFPPPEMPTVVLSAADRPGAAEPATFDTGTERNANLQHQDWQADARANGRTERYKPLTDASGTKLHFTGPEELRRYLTARGVPESAHSHYRLGADGTVEEDILALANQHLGAGNRGENDASSELAMRLVAEELHLGGRLRNPDAFIESAASQVHDAWMDRNRSWAPPEQLVPYSQLSEEEKEKDRVVVRRAIEFFRTQPVAVGFRD